MDLNTKYDLRDVPDAKEFTVVPEGRYHVAVVAVDDMKESAAKNPYLQWTLQIMLGEYAGVKIFDNLTFTNETLNRYKFLASHLADLDIASVSVQDFINALPGKQAIADVKIEKGKINPATGNPYPDKNRVNFTGYSRPDGFAYVGQGAPPPQTSAPAAAHIPVQPVATAARATQPTAPAFAATQAPAQAVQAPVFGGAAPAKKGMPF